jgi:NAD(P)-dependent dehydrogenase (short-subunit alcohol dehydrogenase family)
MVLDLADLASIEQFSGTFKGQYDRLDVLMNNAGVMALPQRETADGFEMHFGTNHLGHFALTIRLIDTLIATPNSRVVTVSSNLHHSGKIQFDDLMSQNNYDKWAAYGQTKLANLLFAYELQRRLENAGASAISLGAHPGHSATNLQHAGPLMAGSKIQNIIMSIANRLFAQDAATGALPQLYAAVSPDAKGGDYIGPDGFRERRGHPKKVQSSTNSHNRQTAEQLWQISETLTNLQFPPQK